MEDQRSELNRLLLTILPFDCLAQGFVKLSEFARYEISLVEFQQDSHSQPFQIDRIVKWPIMCSSKYEHVQFPTNEQYENKRILEIGIVDAVHMGYISLVDYSDVKKALARVQEKIANLASVNVIETKSINDQFPAWFGESVKRLREKKEEEHEKISKLLQGRKRMKLEDKS